MGVWNNIENLWSQGPDSRPIWVPGAGDSPPWVCRDPERCCEGVASPTPGCACAPQMLMPWDRFGATVGAPQSGWIPRPSTCLAVAQAAPIINYQLTIKTTVGF